jgi:hypothetical protein
LTAEEEEWILQHDPMYIHDHDADAWDILKCQNRFLLFVLSDFLRQFFWHNFYWNKKIKSNKSQNRFLEVRVEKMCI